MNRVITINSTPLDVLSDFKLSLDARGLFMTLYATKATTLAEAMLPDAPSVLFRALDELCAKRYVTVRESDLDG